MKSSAILLFSSNEGRRKLNYIHIVLPRIWNVYKDSSQQLFFISIHQTYIFLRNLCSFFKVKDTSSFLTKDYFFISQFMRWYFSCFIVKGIAMKTPFHRFASSLHAFSYHPLGKCCFPVMNERSWCFHLRGFITDMATVFKH